MHQGTGIGGSYTPRYTTNPPPQHGGFGVPGFMHVTPDRPKNGDMIHSAKTLAGLIAPHPANYSRPACLFFCVRVDLFLSRSGFILCDSVTCSLCLQRTSARLPAKASAERSVDSYQQATTVVQATPFAPRRALEQPIRPGAVITLGQALASAGRSRPSDSRTPLASRSQPL